MADLKELTIGECIDIICSSAHLLTASQESEEMYGNEADFNAL